MIQKERVQPLNDKPVQDRDCVVYWMQASQRAEGNHALEFAIRRANERKKPVVVYFGLTDRFPEANARHYAFMLEGLKHTASSLKARDIRMVIRRTSPEQGVTHVARRADLVVVDRGYLHIQKAWRASAAERLDCPLIQVESDVVVPVETASPKEEYSAATFRPKIKKQWEHFLVPLNPTRPAVSSLDMDFESLDISDVGKTVAQLDVDQSVQPVADFHGGTSEANRRLDDFLKNRLDGYAESRNDPNQDALSNMSPYLHFGQISPLATALKVRQTNSPGVEAFLEELLVRRELSMNFVHYNPAYDAFAGLPDWAKKTLGKHEKDAREWLYSPKELENAQTHDPYWNAAQQEMVVRGKMHGYMRMYWGKKILEWSRTPEEAYQTALYLNNKYELDGRDPNGFTGVAWCFGKHDRPWAERPIFGNVRYMNANGLKRKFDADAYVQKIARLSTANS